MTTNILSTIENMYNVENIEKDPPTPEEIRKYNKDKIKDLLKNDDILLHEIINELRSKKILKIKKNITNGKY